MKTHTVSVLLYFLLTWIWLSNVLLLTIKMLFLLKLFRALILCLYYQIFLILQFASFSKVLMI